MCYFRRPLRLYGICSVHVVDTRHAAQFVGHLTRLRRSLTRFFFCWVAVRCRPVSDPSHRRGHMEAGQRTTLSQTHVLVARYDAQFAGELTGRWRSLTRFLFCCVVVSYSGQGRARYVAANVLQRVKALLGW